MSDEINDVLSDLLGDMRAAQDEAVRARPDKAAPVDEIQDSSLSFHDLNIKDLSKWETAELEAAKAYLEAADHEDAELDLTDCPEWVRFCAHRYFDSVLNPVADDVRTVKIFQARTDHERKIRRKIIAARAELWERQDWLRRRGNADELRKEFGDVAGVPDWIRQAAIRDLQQQIYNLSTTQRRNPAERIPL